MLCFAPLVLVGYALTMQEPFHRYSPNVDGAVLQLHTCEQGPGAHVKASSAGLYGLGVQYGFHREWGVWSATFAPQAGFSYADHPIPYVPMRTQFEVGGHLLIGYERWRFGIEYWHLSNAGLRPPNNGLDMLILQTGWSFQ